MATLTLFPITYSKSGVSTNGALSLFTPCKNIGDKNCFEKKIFCSNHEFFLVAKEVSKVDVEEVPRCGDHDVVIVSVSYPLWVT